MKRVLQVVMVALALVTGAGTARASVIAEFSWTEYDIFATDFRLTNLSIDGTVSNVLVEYEEFANVGTFLDADMQLPSLGPGDQAINFVTPFQGEVKRVRVAFDFYRAQQLVQSYDQTFLAVTSLVPEDVASPTFWSFSKLYSVRQFSVPEPASMTLLGLGLAAAAIVRRRRQ
jgi:hypothetical protein